MNQSILHLDMDAFFASVELLDHPEWRGKPLVVGSAPDRRGVVSTASYEARAYGIRSAMPSRTAYSLCPHAIFVPVRMRRYIDMSECVMNVMNRYSPMIEQVSIDEAFLDASGVMRKWKSAEALAADLKNAIREETGLTASVGVATNKFLAKLASDYRKPDGLTVVPAAQAEIERFLAPLPVGRIWGVGRVCEKKLNEAGIRLIGDVQQMTEKQLVPLLGPALASHVSTLARGLDDRPVVTESETKSISAEHTFPEDIENPETVRRTLVALVEQVGRRLRAHPARARTAAIKLRYDDFQTVSRQATVEEPVCSDRRLLQLALPLFENENVRRPVRLIGFGVSSLSGDDEGRAQLDLFSGPGGGMDRGSDISLDRALDRIRDSLGEQAIGRASGLQDRKKKNV